MKSFILANLIDQILKDETLTKDLPEGEAQELVAWLIALAEEGENEQDGVMVRRLGRMMARIAARWQVPVDELIELVEAAWGAPGVESEEEPPLNA